MVGEATTAEKKDVVEGTDLLSDWIVSIAIS